ncbi:hypothetical protein VCR29J2_20106 [Vibrio coralliirubri]|nr:hypothetical protein VCR29J2_20106 [Vibrio coralliirubri]
MNFKDCFYRLIMEGGREYFSDQVIKHEPCEYGSGYGSNENKVYT